MPVYEIIKGMHIILDSDVYQVVAVLPDGKVRLRHHDSRKYQTVSEQTILRAAITPEVDSLIAATQSHHHQPKSRQQKPSGKRPAASPSVSFNRLDLQVVQHAKERTTTDQPWITTVVDSHTRCVLGFALVRNEEMVLRLGELRQELHPVEYDLFGDKTHLRTVGKGRKGETR